jgi:pimeloyl-ACP methyl ester carboxylesterase
MSALQLPYRPRRVPTPVGRMHVLEVRGRGPLPALVLLHGFGARGLHYLRMVGHLRRSFSRIVVPDLPAHGLSATPGPEHGAAAMTLGILATLEAAVPGPALVFGNSMGGLVALRYAMARPERVLGLVLSSPAGAPRDADGVEALKARFRLRSHADALAFVDALFARRHPLRHLMALGVRRGFAKPALRGLIEGIDAGSFLEPAALARLSMPILWAWGTEERILSERDRDFFRAHLPPHAERLEPDGFGHCPFLEDPAAVAAMVVRFAERLPAA